MSLSEKRKASQKKYNDTHTKQYAVRLHNINDYDIIEYLETQKSKGGAIRRALKYYIEHIKNINNDI